MEKKSTSQASWSILSEGVSASRVESHIVRSHVMQMIEAIKEHPQLAEEIYKRCGDNFEAIPKHLSKLERSLDRTNYALITMGSEWYRQRLTHEDREMVDMASKYNPTPYPSTSKQSSIERVASRVFDDFIFDHIDGLVKLDPEFADDSHEKTEALWGGDLEEALRLTRNPKAKAYIKLMINKYPT
jgi:hypothetical protein